MPSPGGIEHNSSLTTPFPQNPSQLEGLTAAEQDFVNLDAEGEEDVTHPAVDPQGPNGAVATTVNDGPSGGNRPTRAAEGAAEAHSNGVDRPSSPGQTNGTGLSRKRSRSGSIIRSTSPPSELPVRIRETPVDKILLEQYVHREFQHAALTASRNTHQEILQQKRAERDYYLSLQQERQLNPAAIFGSGYQGYGNGRTDLGSQHPQLLYPSNRRRPGGRKARDIRISKDDMNTQADQIEDLVPIRLDIEWDKIKLRDTFTWNLHDRVTSPDIFAEKLVEDMGLPLESCGPLVRQISQNIQDQLMDFYPQVFMAEEPLDQHLPYNAYKNDEMRILIKLDITIGHLYLVDQFEWEINNPNNSPEEFAVQMTKDLSLSGEFTTAIAHSIREQIQLFTKSLYILSHPFDGRPVDDPDLQGSFQPTPLPSSFRPVQASKEFMPYCYELSEADLEKAESTMSREQRRQKRSVNRRGGPALPDLRDRQRTIRTLVVSSVIPGAASSIEESRLFKRSGTGRPKRAAAGQRDGADDSDDSDSDESFADSPAMPHLAQGTARTRGMRGAASAAQVAMRTNFGRSATPETSSLLHHETRVSARRREYRDESSDAPDKLIVKLKINREKLRQLLKNIKNKRQQQTAEPGTPTSTTPKASHGSTRSSMGPPPSQSSQNVTTPKRPSASQLNGVIDAPHPPQPGVPGPPPPPWLVRGLNNLKRSYPRDSFEGTMRYTAVDPQSGLPLPNAATTHAGQKLNYKYFPRIRCHDCPGKLYTPGPAMTVDNFEVHLKNRQHKERVEERHAKLARAAAGAEGGVGNPSGGGGGSVGDGEGGDDAAKTADESGNNTAAGVSTAMTTS